MADEVSGQLDATKVPRYAGIATFARLPRIDDVSRYDVAILGVPFDSGVTYRPGARFGPAAIREASRLLRPYNPVMGVRPFDDQQVVDAGDVPATPFDIPQALASIVEAPKSAAWRARAWLGERKRWYELPEEVR